MPYTLPPKAQQIADILVAEGLDLSRWEVGTAPHDGLKLFTHGTRRAIYVTINPCKCPAQHIAISRMEAVLPHMEYVERSSNVFVLSSAATEINADSWARTPATTTTA